MVPSDEETLWLRAEAVELGVLPSRGGRISSLRDLRTDHEWLLQPETRRDLRYGGVFTDGDMAGWDEMVPTIVACPLPGDPARGLPDHGEAWAVPWEVEAADAAHHRMAVSGRVTGYRVTRTVEVTGPAAFALHYELERTEPVAVPLLWAAHPQFVWERGSRVVLEPSSHEVIDVTDARAPHVPWDDASASWLDHAEPGTSRKFWLDPGARPRGVGLTSPSGSLRLRWSASEIPYLGVWFDHGQYAAQPTVALEPSTGYRDDLVFAAEHGTVPVFGAGERRSWTLRLQLEPARRAAPER